MGIMGKYFSFSASSVAANDDLMVAAEVLTGESNLVAKKITLISSGSQLISINSGPNSTLYADVDGLYKLSLDGYDVAVSSIKYPQSSASPVFLAMIY
jgi:hypothetical protein